MSDGFYLMHRGWMDNPAFGNEPYSRRDAWVWLIERAVYAPRKFNVRGKAITLQRGQFCASVRDLAEAWKWTPAKVQRFLTRLKTDTMIDTLTDTGRMVITICNYETYQSASSQSDTVTDKQPIQQRYSSDTQNKQGNKNKEIISPPLSPPCDEEPTSEDSDAQSASPDGEQADLLSAVDPKPKTKPADKRGTRLPEDWQPGPDLLAFAEQQGIPPPVVERETAKFRDYWRGQPGQRGTKLDWSATWRNWLRTVQERQNERHRPAQQQHNQPDKAERRRAILAGLEEAGYDPSGMGAEPRFSARDP